MMETKTPSSSATSGSSSASSLSNGIKSTSTILKTSNSITTNHHQHNHHHNHHHNNNNNNNNNNCVNRKQPNNVTSLPSISPLSSSSTMTSTSKTSTLITSSSSSCSSCSVSSEENTKQLLIKNLNNINHHLHSNSNNININNNIIHNNNNNNNQQQQQHVNSSMTSIAKSLLLSSIATQSSQTPLPPPPPPPLLKTSKVLQKNQQPNNTSSSSATAASEETSDNNRHLENSETPLSSLSSSLSSSSSSTISSTSTSSLSNKSTIQTAKSSSSSFIVNLLPPLVSGASILSSIGSILRRSKCYLASLRAGSFTTSLIPVLMGAVLAAKTTGQFSFVILFATVLTVISVHAAGNLVNTYCDFMRGIDSKRRSDDRTLVDSILTPEEVVNLGVLFYVIGCVGLLIVVLTSPARMELLALMYFGGISSSFLYTGGIGLKYIALGDIIIMVTFGPVSVLYSFIAQTGTIRLVTLLYAIPLALNAEAILHSNNTRDIEDDRKAGCVTIAVLIGYSASHVLFALLLFVPYILFTVVSFHSSLWLLLPLITLPKAFQLERQFRDGNLRSLPKQMARLNFYFGIFYLIACVISPPHKLPGLHV